MYNYFDYRVQNISKDNIYQIILYTTDKYLCGELRCQKNIQYSYHIRGENEYFSREDGVVYRN
jgi:vancomycin resistance protein VanW